ncbi:LOW QUALITY PROTEIN: conserved hypothetical protein, partial [Streptomyces sp. SPB78]
MRSNERREHGPGLSFAPAIGRAAHVRERGTRRNRGGTGQDAAPDRRARPCPRLSSPNGRTHMLGTKMKRALAMGGASLALAGAGVMAASPAFAATTVVAWTHGNVHAGPAKGERVVSYVNANYSYTGLCWLEGDLVNDHGISNCKLGPPPAQQRRDRLRQRRLLKGQRQGQRAQPLL